MKGFHLFTICTGLLEVTSVKCNRLLYTKDRCTEEMELVKAEAQAAAVELGSQQSRICGKVALLQVCGT